MTFTDSADVATTPPLLKNVKPLASLTEHAPLSTGRKETVVNASAGFSRQPTSQLLHSVDLLLISNCVELV